MNDLEKATHHRCTAHLRTAHLRNWAPLYLGPVGTWTREPLFLSGSSLQAPSRQGDNCPADCFEHLPTRDIIDHRTLGIDLGVL